MPQITHMPLDAAIKPTKDLSCNGCAVVPCQLQKDKDNMIEGLKITFCSQYISKLDKDKEQMWLNEERF